jgi:TolB protein
VTCAIRLGVGPGNGLFCTAGTTGNVEDPAFEKQPDIYVMAPVGAALTPLTSNPAYDGEPELSPDSSKVVFVSKRDGSGLDAVDEPCRQRHSPVFSPDGQKIAWVSNRDGDNEIYTMKADGTGQKQIIPECR